MTKKRQVIIVGAGPAGVSAALWCHKLGLDFALIEKDEVGGKLNSIFHAVRGYPGVDETGVTLSEKMLQQIEGFDLIRDEVISINSEQKLIQLKNLELSYEYLILTTGLNFNPISATGDLSRAKYSVPRSFDEYQGESVVVVGSGDGAVENALLMADSCKQVYLISRSNNFKSRKQYLEPAKLKKNIEFIINDEVEGISEKVKLKSGRYIDASHILIKTGFRPASEFIDNELKLDEKGYLEVGEHNQTSNKYIFAAGDICSPLYSSISNAAGSASVAVKRIYKLSI